MKRLLLLLAFASSASAQTGIEALYGTWQCADSLAITVPLPDDPDGFSYTLLADAFELRDGAVVTISVMRLPQPDGVVSLSASESATRYHADGLVLAVNDSLSSRLRPTGERLGVTTTIGDSTHAERIYERTEALHAPPPLLGMWTLYATDNAGMTFDFPVRITPTRWTLGYGKPERLRIVGEYLLTSREDPMHAGVDPVMRGYTAAPYRLSPDGRVLSLGTGPGNQLYRIK